MISRSVLSIFAIALAAPPAWTQDDFPVVFTTIGDVEDACAIDLDRSISFALFRVKERGLKVSRSEFLSLIPGRTYVNVVLHVSPAELVDGTNLGCFVSMKSDMRRLNSDAFKVSGWIDLSMHKLTHYQITPVTTGDFQELSGMVEASITAWAEALSD